jgi:uncharacterized protein (TIGR03790 family)
MSKYIFVALGLAGLFAAVPVAHGQGRGDEVVVIYNTRVPESKDVAEHYAERRQVPSGQVLGFDLSAIETISRMEYRDRLEKPLAKTLRDKNLLTFGSQTVLTTNGGTRRVEGKVTAAKIRYVVLCYGIPLRISPDANLKEAGAETMRLELRRNEAAVDNELACLPLLEQKFMRAGPLANPLFGNTNAASFNPTNGLLMVARLDGPTAGIARSLVDKAIQAETDGLWGRGYFDLRGLTDGSYKVGDDWIHNAAEVCRQFGFETTVDENGGTFPVSFPLSQVAFYAGWYDENVSGPFTQPAVEFMPGAFAYHLHSFSAATLRSTTHNWAGPLLARGATATMGCVYEPFLVGTPNIGVFFQKFSFAGFTFGEAAYACQSFLSWQTTVVGDPLYRPFSKPPLDQLQELERAHSKFLDWCYVRACNLRLLNHEPLPSVVNALESLALTPKSPVAQEKLADLYTAGGKPSSSVYALQQVLKLDPTPQQRTRVMLVLATRLIALDREPEAYAVYQEFVKQFPDYPDQSVIYRQLFALAQKLGKSEDAAKYEHDVSRGTSAHAPAPKGPPLRPGI